MQTEYLITEKEYLEFNRSFIRDHVKSWRALHLLCILVFSGMLAGQPINWSKFIIALISFLIIYPFLLYFLPYYQSKRKLQEAAAKDPSMFEKKTLSFIDDGLLIESASKTTTWPWGCFKTTDSNDSYIILWTVDKKYVLIPRAAFMSNEDGVAFLGLLQQKIYGFQLTQVGISKPKRGRPSYLWGILCLFPGVGLIAGIVFVINGFRVYKDKWFVVMGMGGVLFTICFWYMISYTNILDIRTGMAQASQRELNNVMKDVEFYKLKNGEYPDNLSQLLDDDSNLFITDPLQSGNQLFNYKKVGNHYYLFSSGIDGIPYTEDDIYPQVDPSDSSKFGLIIPKRR